jgi:molecular chaperone DnaK
VQTLIKELTGLEPSKGVNPDEAVALGAAVQGGILAGDVKDIILLDVTPLSLGVEVNGGMVDVLIPKNTTIPTQKKSTYTTAVNNQTEVTIHILQGERPMAKDNKSLGMFNLSGIAPAPARIPQIEVDFSLDANGILSVNAKDLGTGKEQSITITQSSNLDQSEIDRMIKEAEQYAEADKEAKDLVMLKNETEVLCGSIESTLEMSKDKVEQNLIDDVQSALDKTKEALKTNSKSEIETAKEELLQTSHKLSEELYKNVPQDSENDSEVVDAEVVDA